ncbi:siderophore-interacting protein [Vibrio ostreicida]|uniref:Siderophore-interacting protein n=1 Tax=Vibrio ostreicida TaxID=526588 RepID=A0ABT8BXE1_9VIBR|nr:siderophore-interacting protein [Vibrio ostreicida]MDN3611061.1 siderophore-interacting protein [Vibrio ostreicida]
MRRGLHQASVDQQGHPLQESIEGQPRPTMRTYTIRRFDHESRAIESTLSAT